MGRFWKVVLGVLGALWTFVALAATIPAHQAVSNLQSWAELFGLTTLAASLAHPSYDHVVFNTTVIAMIATLALTFYYQRTSNTTNRMLINIAMAILSSTIFLGTLFLTWLAVKKP